ncbi:MAG: alpha/beta fold hydrolase [Spirochaetaceae bacterium]|jgi:carboxylesterase|nr:alpha/beta fold hydrolase [Spirochaetaceae bacterium]
MLLKKIIFLIFITLCLNLAVFIHIAFIFPVLVLSHLLFNETDFFYRENSIYEETDLSRLFSPEAGPIEVANYNTDKAIIFVHGFPSCPATFKYVIPMAEKAGYDVYAPLLPGFGTNKDDLIKSNFSQWFIYLCGFYVEAKRKYDKVYVVGLSLGGSLTLKLAERYSGTDLEPNGISITAAPVLLNSIRHRMNKTWLLYFIRSLSWFIKYIDSSSESWKNMDDNHSEWLGYRGKFPVQSYSIKMAVEKIRIDLKKITVPIIAFHVPEDRTVNYKNLSNIEKNVSSSKAVFKILEYKGFYNTSHCLFLYESIREKLMNDILAFFDEI